jgi:hypothetical protein
MDNEHCMLLALPCGRDHMDVLQQSNNLQTGFITYLQQKQAAGIVNIAAPGSQQVNVPFSFAAEDVIQTLNPTCYLLHSVSCFANSLTWKMGAIHLSEMLVNFNILHSVLSHKIELIITTAVRISYPTY